MGISDDIKPRKVYNYSHNVSKEPVKKVSFELEKKPKSVPEKPVHEIDEKLDQFMSTSDEMYPNKDTLENDFFDGSEAKPQPNDHKKSRSRAFVKISSWILVIIVIVIVLYKNLDQLEILILGEQENTSEPSASEEIYTSEASGTTDTSATSGTTTTTDTLAVPANDTSSASDMPTTIAKKDIKIEILNGNGISGSADKVRDLLIADGFLISKVANAKKFTYTSTYIYYKTGAEASMELVKAALSSRTCVAQKSDPITTGYDIVIVVGKK